MQVMRQQADIHILHSMAMRMG